MNYYLQHPFRWLTILLLAASITTVSAQKSEYTVSWLGIPVVDVSVTWNVDDTPWTAEYTAATKHWFNRIYSIDNKYTISLTPETLQPLDYEKFIIEEDILSHFTAKYDSKSGRIEYANGLQRPWSNGNMNLFSSLAWVERRTWEAGSLDTILVEVEGTMWDVEVECIEVQPNDETGSIAELRVSFLSIASGEPVLSTTDMVTAMLPGENHILNFWVNIEKQQVLEISFGTIPFQIRARLN